MPAVPKRLLVAGLIVAVASPVALELGFRAVLALRGQAYDGAATRARIQALLNASVDFVPALEEGPRTADPTREVVHPYLGFEHPDDLGRFAEIAARSRAGADPEAFEILILGGSVAGMFGWYGTERLTELLQADPRFAGREIRYLEFGRGAFKQPQQTLYAIYLLTAGVQPEAVLNLDGFNEVALGNDNVERGANPLYPTLSKWAHVARGAASSGAMVEAMVDARLAERALVAGANRALERGYARSAVLGTLSLERLEALASERAEAFERYTRELVAGFTGVGVRGPGVPREEGLQLAVDGWARASTLLREVCEARGIPYLHVLQPTLCDPGSKPLSAEERRTSTAPNWVAGVRAGYPLLREAGRRLRAEGEAFLDATRVFAGTEETLYVDSCHFNARGNEILAEAIGAAFLTAAPR